MRSNIGTISNRKPGSTGLSQIHNFSNYNPAIKSRTQYVTPHTLSPPPQANHRQSNISRKSTNQNNHTFEASSQNDAKTPITIKPSQQKREFVSMDELLGYLNYINNQPGNAFKADTIPLEEITQQNKKKAKQSTNLKQTDYGRKLTAQAFSNSQRVAPLNVQNSLKIYNEGQQEEGSDDGSSITDTKKKLNKNRAIKRIIQTAFDLLEKNYHFTDNELSSLDNQRSTSTQFNIYLKQYNRIIEQINSKELQEQMKFNRLQDENEDELQQVFDYTVMDDFRQKLSVMFTKQKVSKGNVNIMISAFRDALVMLKINEMKVEYLNSDQPAKTFKISEIQNVEYFTHPYIFIVLTITRDKTKSKQHLYLKFSSQQNQNKWDRALYCCYMSRKMNKKDKLFEIEFPVQDVMKKQKQEFKKQDEEYHFENNNDFHIVDKCFKEIPDTQSLTSNYPTYDMDGQRNMISDRSQYMNMAKNRNLTQQKITISIHNPDSTDNARRLNTVQNKSSKYDNPFRNLQLNTNNKSQKQELGNQPIAESMVSFGGQMKRTNSQNVEENQIDPSIISNKNQPLTTVKKQPSVFSPHDDSQQSMNYSKKSTFNPDQQQPFFASSPFNRNGTFSPQGSQSPIINNSKSANPFMRLLKVTQTQSQRQRQNQQKQSKFSSEQMLRKDTLVNERMKKIKRIREIQKSNVRGIVCQKQRFFMNKQKIVFFHDQNLISSARKGENELMYLETLKNIESRQYQTNKYLQYWDYDYKKDLKEQKKLISVYNIAEYELVPSQLAQTTSTLTIKYVIIQPGSNNSKSQQKQLRLLFANPITQTTNMNSQMNISKAQQVHQWIRLVKQV